MHSAKPSKRTRFRQLAQRAPSRLLRALFPWLGDRHHYDPPPRLSKIHSLTHSTTSAASLDCLQLLEVIPWDQSRQAKEQPDNQAAEPPADPPFEAAEIHAKAPRRRVTFQDPIAQYREIPPRDEDTESATYRYRKQWPPRLRRHGPGCQCNRIEEFWPTQVVARLSPQHTTNAPWKHESEEEKYFCSVCGVFRRFRGWTTCPLHSHPAKWSLMPPAHVDLDQERTCYCLLEPAMRGSHFCSYCNQGGAVGERVALALLNVGLVTGVMADPRMYIESGVDDAPNFIAWHRERTLRRQDI